METLKSPLSTSAPSPQGNLKCKGCRSLFEPRQMLPGNAFCSVTCLVSFDEKKISNTNKAKIKRIWSAATLPDRNKYPLQKKKKKKANEQKQVIVKHCKICKSRIAQSRIQSDFCSKKCKRKQIIIPIKKVNNKPLVRIDLWSDENKDRWLKLRYETFRMFGRKCMVCGATDDLQVDHIKPKSLFPELAFDSNNLQILCKACNFGKGNYFSDDWRTKDARPSDV